MVDDEFVVVVENEVLERFDDVLRNSECIPECDLEAACLRIGGNNLCRQQRYGGI